MPYLKAARAAMAGAWFAGSVLCAGYAGALWAQTALGGGAPAGYEAHAKAEEERWHRLRAEQRHQMQRAAAHARMPDTMYASTPDEVMAPHPFPLEVVLKGAPARGTVPQRSVSTRTHRVGLFPPAADAQGRQGFARVVNRSGESGEVRIDAFDDAGMQYGPLTLEVGAGGTVHFNSGDLERGNAIRG